MTLRLSVLRALGALLALSVPVNATAQVAPIAVERFGLYVVADNVERAEAFYQRIFGKAKVRVLGMVGFEIAGGLYAIVERRRFAATAVRGDTVRAYIRVANVEQTYKVLAAIVPGNLDGSVVREGAFGFFRLRDPDGNLLEFYALKTP